VAGLRKLVKETANILAKENVVLLRNEAVQSTVLQKKCSIFYNAEGKKNWNFNAFMSKPTKLK
jgi:hypothetical protein